MNMRLESIYEFHLVRADGKRNASAIAMLEESAKRVLAGEISHYTVEPTEHAGVVRVIEYVRN